MKLNKIETSEALSLTKPSYSVPPELEAAWLGYKHSIQGGKKNEEEQESFWKNVVEDVEKGLGLVKPWKRDGAEEVEAELLGKGRGHGVPLSGQSGLSLTCFVFSLFTECLCSSSLFILRLLHSTSIHRSPPISSTPPFIHFSAFSSFHLLLLNDNDVGTCRLLKPPILRSYHPRNAPSSVQGGLGHW